MIRSLALGSALALAACGETAPTANDAANAQVTVPEGNYLARIEALAPGQRDAVMLRAIRDAGRDCQGVTGSERAGEVEGAPAWLATCEGGLRWVVVLNAQGIATVTNAAELKAAGA